jgi:hypothetical protein
MRASICPVKLPTAEKEYRSSVGSAGKTGDSQFRTRFLSVPIISFMILIYIWALIGAVFSLKNNKQTVII